MSCNNCCIEVIIGNAFAVGEVDPLVCSDLIDDSLCNGLQCVNDKIFASKPPVHVSANCEMSADRVLTDTDISALCTAGGNSNVVPTITNLTSNGFGLTFIPTPVAWVNSTTTSTITTSTGCILVLDIVYGGEIKPGNLHLSNITSITNTAGMVLDTWETEMLDGFYQYLSPATQSDNGQNVAVHQILWTKVISGGSGTLTINFANNTTALGNYAVQQICNVDTERPFIQQASEQGGGGATFTTQTMNVRLDDKPKCLVYLSGTSAHVDPLIAPTYNTDSALTNLSDRFQGDPFGCNDHLHTGYGNIQVFQYTSRANDTTGDVRRPVHVALLELNCKDTAGTQTIITGTDCSLNITNINDCTAPTTAYNGYLTYDLNGLGVEFFIDAGNDWAVQAYVDGVLVGQARIDNTDSTDIKHFILDGINASGVFPTIIPPGGNATHTIEYRFICYNYTPSLLNGVIIKPYTFNVNLMHQ